MDRMANEEFREANTAAAVGVLAGKEIARAEQQCAADIKTAPNGLPYRITANGAIERLDYFAAGPAARMAVVSVYTSDSFSAYINRFKDPTSVVFADVLARKFTGVMSYFKAGPEGAGEWDKHRVDLQLRATPNWAIWEAANKKEMDQATFAQFIEDNLCDIAEPAGAMIVQIARTLEAKVNAVFSSDIRPDNGSYAFAYAEDVQSQAGRGTLTIPNEFTLVLQPFEGSKTYQVKARFRHKLRSGKLSMWFDLIRIEDVIRTAFAEEQDRIDDAINTSDTDPELPILAGPAPKQAA